MPVSDAEGKEWSKDLILQLQPRSVVDVGPGVGTYSKLLRQALHASWTGIEVFEPYIDAYGLRGLYDTLVVADVRDIELPEADLYILGDVVEHMLPEDGVRLIKRVSEVSRYYLVSLPIIHSPQGCVNGNEHERHLAQWSFDEMREVIQPVESLRGNVLGVFWAKGARS